MRRQFPDTRIILVGCLADAVENETALFPDTDLLAGNRWKSRIGQVVQHAMSDRRALVVPDEQQDLKNERSRGPKGRIRAFLKIQDGCSRACTYCRTTQVRGIPRSKAIEDVIAEASMLLANGFPEIVLTGIDLAQYAPPGSCLADVVAATAKLDGLRRLRLASINPSGITSELIESCGRNPIVSPHFHVPLQSGDSGILVAMGRGYDVGAYVATIERIRSLIPDSTFGTDIIVGFPGESDEAFANTCTMLDLVGYSNLHAFRYSPRPGTAAARWTNQVPSDVKKQRSKALIERWEAGLGRTLDNRIGSTQDVLVEERQNDRWCGYTHDYLYVHFSSSQKFPVGSIVPVRIISRAGVTLEGVHDHRIDAS
jgi:threonylcarbamoyladenosine tRNA methylthiotransferase MtaB